MNVHVPRTRRSASRASIILSIAIIAAAGCGQGADSPAASSPTLTSASPSIDERPVVLILGDSLVAESRVEIARRADDGAWNLVVRAVGGTAPCDWISVLAEGLRDLEPDVVTLQTSANAGERPCMADPQTGRQFEIGTAEYFARYRRDLQRLVDAATSSGAHVIFFRAPPFADARRDDARTRINAIADRIDASNASVTASDAVFVALSDAGGYTDELRCLADEREEEGCRSGSIPVRTQWPAQDRGLHLCPTGLIDTSDGLCPGYSSGARRLADAVVEAISRHGSVRGGPSTSSNASTIAPA